MTNINLSGVILNSDTPFLPFSPASISASGVRLTAESYYWLLQHWIILYQDHEEWSGNPQDEMRDYHVICTNRSRKMHLQSNFIMDECTLYISINLLVILILSVGHISITIIICNISLAASQSDVIAKDAFWEKNVLKHLVIQCPYARHYVKWK